MTERYCPITEEPLPLTDPGRVVSQSACNQLRVAASNLADIMHTLDQMLRPGSAPTSGGGGHTMPASRPPLNLGLPATLIHPLVFDGADMERAQQPAIKALGAPGTVRYVDDVIRAVLGAVGEVEA